MSGADIIRTLLELLEAQEQITIMCDIEEGKHEDSKRTNDLSCSLCQS